MGKGAKVKGFILNVRNNSKLVFQYNPSTFDYSRSFAYTTFIAPGMSYPKTGYVSGGALTFPVELFFYCKNEKVNTVTNAINFIESVTPKKKNSKVLTVPPSLIFSLGTFICRCQILDYNVHIEEWDSVGNPVNAKINLNMTMIGVK